VLPKILLILLTIFLAALAIITIILIAWPFVAWLAAP